MCCNPIPVLMIFSHIVICMLVSWPISRGNNLHSEFQELLLEARRSQSGEFLPNFYKIPATVQGGNWSQRQSDDVKKKNLVNISKALSCLPIAGESGKKIGIKSGERGAGVNWNNWKNDNEFQFGKLFNQGEDGSYKSVTSCLRLWYYYYTFYFL